MDTVLQLIWNALAAQRCLLEVQLFFFIILEFIPITLFFVCVVVFRINLMAGPLLGYVLFCQVIAIEADYYGYIINYMQSHISTPLQLLLQSSLILCRFWCLKSYIPPFCISEHPHSNALSSTCYVRNCTGHRYLHPYGTTC